jgi:hypothetical protein
LLIGAGDCKDASLLNGIRDFHSATRGLIESELYDPNTVLEVLRERPLRSIWDIERQVETGKALLYGGQSDRGLEQLAQALGELERAAPSAEPWRLTTSALVLQAQMLKNLDRHKEAMESFRRILRIDPAFKLDPDAFPPSTIALLETVRREHGRSKKFTLRVHSPTPGASVFIDGREAGKTPLRAELVSGTYRLVLVDGDRASFPHRVNLARDDALSVDVQTEGAMSQHIPLCAQDLEDSAVLHFGTSVTADLVVVVRNAAAKGDPPYMTAVLYDLSQGRRLRNAGASIAALRSLAVFIVTGQEQKDVRTGAAGELPLRAEVVGPPPPPPPLDGRVDPSAEFLPVPQVAPSKARHAPTVEGVSPPARVLSFTVMGVGVAAAIGGVVGWTMGDADRAVLEGSKDGEGRLSPTTSEAALRLLKRVNDNATISIGLAGAGLGCVVAGTLGVLLFPEGNDSVAVIPLNDGVMLSAGGKF